MYTGDVSKKFNWKNVAFWAVSALAGLLFMALLNFSPLSRLGLNIELLVGWQDAPHIDCLAEGCDVTSCEPGEQEEQGLPFVMSRTSKAPYCGSDFNNLAFLFNILMGLGIGVLYAVVASKRFQVSFR